MMIDQGGQACFMKDKKGYLPAHVACSRHCSPEKLRMLLAVNPGALFDKTNDGNTLLDLAKKQATKSHPNYALIEELNRQLAGTHRVSSEEEDSANRSRLDSNDSAKSWHTYESAQSSPSQPDQQQPQGTPHLRYQQHNPHEYYPYTHAPPTMVYQPYHSASTMIGAQALLGLDEYHHPNYQQQPYHLQYHGQQHHYQTPPHRRGMMSHENPPPPAPRKKTRSSRKRKTNDEAMVDDTQPAVDLLLHFSRNGNGTNKDSSNNNSNIKSPRRRVIPELPPPLLAVKAAEEGISDESMSVLYQQPYHRQQSKQAEVTEV